MSRDAFFHVHRDLPREGPGEPADVHWALGQIDPPGRVLDAACGPGADIVTLAEALPDAQILGVEKQLHFVEDARDRTARFGARVAIRQGDMFDVEGPFDLIWCAGAVYFAGVRQALSAWSRALAPGGSIVFSEPVLPDGAGPGAAAFWAEYPAITDAAGILARVRDAGFSTHGTRLIIGAPWQAYYTPMAARIAKLRANDPSDDVRKACAINEAEIDAWSEARDEIAYLAIIARP